LVLHQILLESFPGCNSLSYLKTLPNKQRGILFIQLGQIKV